MEQKLSIFSQIPNLVEQQTTKQMELKCACDTQPETEKEWGKQEDGQQWRTIRRRFQNNTKEVK